MGSTARVAVVLLPGLDGSGFLFRPFTKHLPPELQPVVVAYPPDQLLGYAELLPLVLAALPRELPFILLGESFSGPLALMAAATRPPNLMGVVLCASFVRNPVWCRPAWLRHLARPMAFRFFPALSRAKAVLLGHSASELRALSAEALSDVRPAVLAHRVRTVLCTDVLEQLRSCPVPILYLRGERDFIVPGHNAREIVAARPSVRVARIPSSHWLLQTHPKAATAAIETFLKVIEKARGGA